MRVLLGLVMLLSSCATVQPTRPARADDAQLEAAIADHMNCLIPYAKKLDDGISDATTIARAIAPSCPDTIRAALSVMGAGLTPNQQHLLSLKRPEAEFDMARQVVLQLRADKRR